MTTTTTALPPTLDTALAVIPPDEAWDRLQRARHVANDNSYGIWPPAIRLFHPFCAVPQLHDTAFAIAAIVEKYGLEPFAVTLSQWSILPHQEAMESHFQKMQQLPDVVHDDNTHKELSTHDQKVQDLIASEELIGKEKRAYRQRQQRKRDIQALREQGLDLEAARNGVEQKNAGTNSTDSKKQAVSEPTLESGEEFNGPCVICLEPDEESTERLQAIRHLLQCELEGAQHYANLYSPTGSVALSVLPGGSTDGSVATTTPSSTQQPPSRTRRRHFPWNGSRKNKREEEEDVQDPSTFRPLVPIAAYKTVSSAIPVARKLRKLWDPLTFNVTDLHLVSCREMPDTEDEPQQPEKDGLLQEYYGRYKQIHQHHSSEEHRYASEYSSSSSQFGCDALVSFIGEEVEMDEQLNQDMAKMLWEHGSPGGGSELAKQASRQDAAAAAESDNKKALPLDLSCLDEKEEGLSSDLEQWLLEEEEEFDEGTVVVIGRTQFFTGEARKYVGMPASSALDAQNRMNGEQFATAAARRLRGISAKGFNDGDFGSRRFLSWGKSSQR